MMKRDFGGREEDVREDEGKVADDGEDEKRDDN